MASKKVIEEPKEDMLQSLKAKIQKKDMI